MLGRPSTFFLNHLHKLIRLGIVSVVCFYLNGVSMIKKIFLIGVLGLSNAIFASGYFQTLAHINQALFYDNIAGNSNEYWLRLPGMTSFNFIVGLNELYQNNYSDATLQAEPRIPLIVHQIWLGPRIPKHLISMIGVWQQLPAPWQYKLWTEKEIEALELTNYDLYAKADNYAEKSDIVRYEILLRYGGVYVDCDVDLIRPEELQKMHMNYDFYAGLEQLSDQRTFSIGNSIIGCVPNHPVIHHMVKEMKAWNDMAHAYYVQEKESGRHIEKWEPTCLRTGPGYLSAMFYTYGLGDTHFKNIIFPPDTFYPYDFTQDKPDIVARHGYEGSWLKRGFISLRELYALLAEFLARILGFEFTYVPPYYGCPKSH